MGCKVSYKKTQGYFAFLLIFLCLNLFANSAFAQDVVDSINGANSPIDTGPWSATTYGIEYTPGSNYEVARIEANWNGVNGDGRTITIEVYDANPNSGGVKLSEGTFSQTGAGWQGADLNTPVSFVSGEDYFIGFGNPGNNMGRFFLRDPNATNFTVWWGNSPGDYVTEDTPGDYHDPIWRFMGTPGAGSAPVETLPVPASSTLSLFLLILLMAGTGIYIVRRNKIVGSR